MSETPVSLIWGAPFRAARAFDNTLEIVSYASKAALVGALTAPIPFYWNPPFWTIALSWPRPAWNTVETASSLRAPVKEARPDDTHANDNVEENLPMAA